MQLDQRVLAGVGGALVGAVLVYAGGTAGRADLEARLARQDDTQASVAALDSALAQLDQRVDAGLTDLAGRVDLVAAAAADQSALGALSQRVEALSSEFPSAVAGVGDQVRGALSGDLEALATQLAELARPAVASVASAEPAAADVPSGPPASVSLGEGTAIRVGQLQPVAEGLRVFLSGVDGQTGTVRVAVNGVRTTELRLDQTAAFGDCALTLTGIEGRAASVDGRCGATAAAESDAEVQQAAASQEGAGEMPDGAIGIGQTAVLADGAVRVFLSSVDSGEGVARIAANGWRPGAVAVGMPVEVGPCSVVMTHVAPGAAAFEGNCEDGGATGIVPAKATADEPAMEEGTEIKIGETTQLGDALRVFLSSVDPDAETARVAINGTQLTTLALALPHQAGECTIELVGIKDRTATVGGSC